MSSTHFKEFTYVEKLLSFLYYQFSYIRKSYVQLFLDIGTFLTLGMTPSGWYGPSSWNNRSFPQLIIRTYVNMYVYLF